MSIIKYSVKLQDYSPVHPLYSHSDLQRVIGQNMKYKNYGSAMPQRMYTDTHLIAQISVFNRVDIYINASGR